MAVAADEAACLGEAIPRVDMKSVELQEYCSVGYCKLFVIYVSYDMSYESYVSRVCTHLKYLGESAILKHFGKEVLS